MHVQLEMVSCVFYYAHQNLLLLLFPETTFPFFYCSSGTQLGALWQFLKRWQSINNANQSFSLRDFLPQKIDSQVKLLMSEKYSFEVYQQSRWPLEGVQEEPHGTLHRFNIP